MYKKEDLVGINPRANLHHHALKLVIGACAHLQCLQSWYHLCWYRLKNVLEHHHFETTTT